MAERNRPLDDRDIGAGAGIQESKLALASDAAAGVASRRSLGTGSQQAAAGDHRHGLPAGAHALGDATGAGAFVQHGVATTGVEAGGPGLYYASVAITFPVPYSAPPVLLVTANGSPGNSWAAAVPVTATGATLYAESALSGQVAGQPLAWLAIGS